MRTGLGMFALCSGLFLLVPSCADTPQRAASSAAKASNAGASSPGRAGKVPAAFDARRSWVVPNTLGSSREIPVAELPEESALAYVEKADDHYVLQVRDQVTGAVRWTSRPWPVLENSTDWEAGFPHLLRIRASGSERLVVWSQHGQRKGEREVRTARIDVYAPDAEGRGVEPVRTLTVSAPMAVGYPEVADSGNGRLLLSWEGYEANRGRAFVADVSNGSVRELRGEGTDCRDRQCDVTAVTADGRVVTRVPGGFEYRTGPGGDHVVWTADQITPPGADRGKDNDGRPNGTVEAVIDGKLITLWRQRGDRDSARGALWAVIDPTSGRTLASVPCADLSVADQANGVGRSPSRRFLFVGAALLDLRRNTGACTSTVRGRGPASIRSVGDDGMAYGSAADGAEERATVPVSLNSTTGQTAALPDGVIPPSAVLNKAGLFQYPDDFDLAVHPSR